MAQVNCPNCGASLQVDPDNIKSVMFCMHCGTRITDFDDLVRDSIKHKQQIEIDTLHHNQELERMEAEAKLEVRKANRIAAAKGAGMAANTATGCFASCLGFIGQSILSIIIGVAMLAVFVALFIKFLPQILDFFLKLFETIFGSIFKAVFK